MKRDALTAIIGLITLMAILTASWMARSEGIASLFGIRAEFLLFGVTLAGVALLHDRTLEVAVAGLASILILKLFIVGGFDLLAHLRHESLILINLLGLLLGFAVLARHFEESRLPDELPHFLPDDWKGGFVLLIIVFVLSAFLDNIAAAMIGGTIAMAVYKGRVALGYLAAIVAASNAGGSGSVLGDTTTTMMWIDGVSAGDVLHAYVAAVPALLIFGIAASLQQHRHQPIEKEAPSGLKIIWRKLALVAFMLGAAILTNVLLDFPAVGVWAAIIIGALLVNTDWKVVPQALKGSLFLLTLVLCASLMPVEELPAASWQSALALGFLSSVFDNIPLTKLALDQGGYDWGFLAYAVGFGGSMIWFGSSAGVALANIFPQAKSVGGWLLRGWHVTAAYVVGFFVLLVIIGWQPHAPHKAVTNGSSAVSQIPDRQ